MELYPEKKKLINWLKKAGEMVSFQGLPSRICWLKIMEKEQKLENSSIDSFVREK